MKTFVTNVAGPVYVSHAFLPLLEKGGKKTIVNISTTLGSIGTDFGPGQTSYSISKAALNMLVRPLAARGDIWSVVVLMCPVDVQAGENASGYHDHLHEPRMAGNGYVRRYIACRAQSLMSCRRCRVGRTLCAAPRVGRGRGCPEGRCVAHAREVGPALGLPRRARSVVMVDRVVVDTVCDPLRTSLSAITN